MGAGKQVVQPPQRGIFPLDHGAECRAAMEVYLSCLKEHMDKHHPCRDYSKDYLQCRMDRQLMSPENLDQLGFSKDAVVEGAREYDSSKEKAGFTAGKHISKESKWWWQR
jgi:cytochrome c oxidase assembly protein subunit 19